RWGTPRRPAGAACSCCRRSIHRSPGSGTDGWNSCRNPRIAHAALGSAETGLEGRAGEFALHVLEQRTGRARQLDAHHRQSPENRQQTAVDQAQLVAEKVLLLGEQWRDAGQALAQLLAELLALRLGRRRSEQRVDQAAPVTLDAVH